MNSLLFFSSRVNASSQHNCIPSRECPVAATQHSLCPALQNPAPYPAPLGGFTVARILLTSPPCPLCRVSLSTSTCPCLLFRATLLCLSACLLSFSFVPLPTSFSSSQLRCQRPLGTQSGVSTLKFAFACFLASSRMAAEVALCSSGMATSRNFACVHDSSTIGPGVLLENELPAYRRIEQSPRPGSNRSPVPFKSFMGPLCWLKCGLTWRLK